MKKPGKTRGKQLGVSLAAQEWEQVRALAQRSTCRTLSEYARKRLLARPIQFGWRNLSFDGFVEEVVLLRSAMDAITMRAEWTAEEKEKLLAVQAEIKAVIGKIVDICTPT